MNEYLYEITKSKPITEEELIFIANKKLHNKRKNLGLFEPDLESENLYE